MPPTAHANLGASKAERWLNCPGSVAMEDGLPDFESPYAVEGTGAHALGEKSLIAGRPPGIWVGTTLEGVEVTEEMAEAVDVYTEYVWSRITESTDVLHTELQFTLESLNPPGPMFSTADAVIWSPATKLLEIVDYKHGQGITVSAVENKQLMYYALGAVVHLMKKPQRIRTTIVQPRGHHPEGIIRSYEFGFAELQEFKRTLFEGAERTLDPDAPLAVGDWCRFCKAAPTCPEQKKHAVEAAQSAFDEPEAYLPPKPELLSDEQLILVLDRAKLIKEWLGTVAAYAVDRVNKGTPLPGYKLVPKRTNRRWKTEEDARSALLGMGFEDEDLYTKKFLTPAKAERKIKADFPKGARPVLPGELWVKPEPSGYNLAPEGDARPALLPSVDMLTADLDGENDDNEDNGEDAT